MSDLPRVAGYLSQALSHEMTVVQQYFSQDCLSERWGLGKELQHGGQIISHGLGFSLIANATRLAPVQPGRTLDEMLRLDRQRDLDVVLLYEEPGNFANGFATLLANEQAHLGELDRRLATLAEKERHHD